LLKHQKRRSGKGKLQRETLPDILQALTDNPVGAVVLVALGAFMLVGFVVYLLKP
jgi:Flp pilus assembly protein TadB